MFSYGTVQFTETRNPSRLTLLGFHTSVSCCARRLDTVEDSPRNCRGSIGKTRAERKNIDREPQNSSLGRTAFCLRLSRGPVGADKAAVDAIRGFMAILGDTDVGLFVCTGGFTRDAEDQARRQEKQRRLLPLRPVYYLAPDE